MPSRPRLRTASRFDGKAYLLRGAARWRWQHSIAPTEALRYSITLRTARG